MRLTVHFPDLLEREIKAAAKKEKKSISSFVAEAVNFYIKEARKKRFGEKVLQLKAKISPDILETLHSDRHADDRA